MIYLLTRMRLFVFPYMFTCIHYALLVCGSFWNGSSSTGSPKKDPTEESQTVPIYLFGYN